MSTAKITELLSRVACKECGGNMQVVNQTGKANISITMICMNKHEEVWNSTNLLPKNENNRRCKQTPLMHLVGAILSGLHHDQIY